MAAPAVAPACVSAPLWRFVAMGGAALMILSFFLPWWSIDFFELKRPQRPELDRAAAMSSAGRETYEDAQKDYEKKLAEYKKVDEAFDKQMESLQQATVDTQLFAVDVLSRKAITKLNPREKGSATAFGWGPGSGIVTFIFGLIILPLMLVPMFVSILKKWSWAMSMPAAVLGLVVLILSVVFWIGSPGENVSGMVEQGVSIGPFVALAGGLAAAGGAALTGICGLMGFLKGLKAA
ncbi:MAG: hypothetical protein E4H18_03425 [Hyphomicrobiales bacterium]|nr:MAG: hypothetical protein E4H18_03425 [Hyphomicrobiales bacterium]